MRRSVPAAVGLLLVLLVGAWGYGRWKNPEEVALDASARAQAPGRFVTLSSGITHYDLTGPDAERTVVLASGYSLPYYAWDWTVGALTGAGYRVLRYEYFGRGYSDRPDVDYDTDLYVAQLGELLDSLSVTEPVDLMGLSFGGFVTASFVTRHPERVRTVTFVDPQTESTPVPWSMRLPVIGPWLWQIRVVPGMADGQLTDFLHPEEAPAGYVDRYRYQMRYRGFGRALLRTDATTADTDFPALYAGVGRSGVPALAIWGRQDPVVPFETSRILREGIPGLRFEPIDSAGHLPHIEQARTVNAVMLDFLAAHGEDISPARPRAARVPPSS